MKSVAIFGAGISGLSATHEFARLGYAVAVYEANADAGGFFRSARMPQDQGMPSEYSWHGFGPWYHNVFDVMKQIPFDEKRTVYDAALSRPINYGIVGDRDEKAFGEENVFSMFQRFRMTWLDKITWSILLFKTWTSNIRTKKHYSSLNAAEVWRPLMSERAWKTWRATFGPWVGCDWTRASLHHVGQFFRRNIVSYPSHIHEADEDGGAWTQGSGDGWLLLKGPSNEFWFEKWISFLRQKGVSFFWKQSLQQLSYDGKHITQALLASGEKVEADIYVLAINPFAAAEIIDRTPALAEIDQLRLFRPLIADGPHTQVSFRIAFSEKILWPKERSAFLLPDSEFNITLFAQEQVWPSDVSLGKEVKSLWTGTACVASEPGKIFNLPLENCTQEQFIEEIQSQLLRCEELQNLLRAANEGHDLHHFPILRIEVWHEWKFSPEGITPKQPKWVMSNHTQPYLPTQKTPVPNLLLAGAHTKTDADIWSIEGAVESGRRAAQIIEPSVRVIPQYKPLWLRIISSVDDVCFSLHLPHIFDLFLFLLCASLIVGGISILI
ncbi:MAG: FAD-dependent oxidoreductase [Patescibacteria group bacterium]